MFQEDGIAAKRSWAQEKSKCDDMDCSGDYEDDDDGFTYYSPGMEEYKQEAMKSQSSDVEIRDSSLYNWFPQRKSREPHPSGKSASQIKKEKFHKAERKIWAESHGKSRPQEVYPLFAKQRRRNNTGKDEFSRRLTDEDFKRTTLSPGDFTVSKSWELYSSTGGIPKPKWVQTPEELKNLISILSKDSEFAIDLEGHCVDTKHTFTALIQIGTWTHGDFLVDSIALYKHVREDLKIVLENSSITKIVHGAGNDIKQLKKDFDIEIIKILDTQILYQVVNGGPVIGLENLSLLFYPGKKDLLSTNETLSDWRNRGKDFTQSQLVYATNDVHVLLRVFDQMRDICLSHGKDGTSVLTRAFDRSKELCKDEIDTIRKDNESEGNRNTWIINAKLRLTTHKVPEKVTPWHLWNKATLDKFGTRQNEVFECLVEWRHKYGNLIDRKDKDFLSNYNLMKISQRLPENVEELKHLLRADFTIHVERQADVIIKIVMLGQAHLDHLNNVPCHNCLAKGHVAALCPDPEEKGKFYKLDANKELRTAMNRRKRIKKRAKKREKKRILKEEGKNPEQENETGRKQVVKSRDKYDWKRKTTIIYNSKYNH